jgi:hypothetical protein
MTFAYFDKLTSAQQRTYRKSDMIRRIEVPDAAPLMPLAAAIGPALGSESPREVERACQALADATNAQLKTPPIVMRVLARRPADAGGELQGLYEPDEVTGGTARITLWMRTAQREQIVKFRTFLRTLVHELCHHFDYELYRLDETFHTEGFYARESAMMRELLGETRRSVDRRP